MVTQSSNRVYGDRTVAIQARNNVGADCSTWSSRQFDEECTVVDAAVATLKAGRGDART